ncbi:MAG: DUF3306 domain-containing protein [Gammaproteobacteria bacterium]|nr:DUF3306 domain-containing protein [Gammaproteobacteria bacterium]
MNSNEGESVLSRWSRRKLEAEQELPDVEQASPVEPPARLAEPVVEEIEAPPLTDADMPDIESLTEDSDFSGFMSPGVSDELRNLALRKLFRAPVFNIRDGLDEYDEDYTSFEKLGDIVTCDMKHQIEIQEQKLRETMEAENEVVDEAELEDVESIDDEDEDEAVISAEDDVKQPEQGIAATDDSPRPATRADDE